MRPSYFKMDRSWMWEERFKMKVANAQLTQTRYGSNMERLEKRMEGLWGHPLEFKKRSK